MNKISRLERFRSRSLSSRLGVAWASRPCSDKPVDCHVTPASGGCRLNLAALAIAFAALVSPVLYGQPSNEESRLELTGTPGIYKFTWQSQPGRTYFILSSEDLVSPWVYVPAIEVGNGTRLEYGFETNATRIFFRLKYTDQPISDPYTDDFDGDGVSNWDELQAGIDPFNPDTDGDGMSDGYEITMGLNPALADGHLDKDGDGVPNEADARPGDPSIGLLQVTILTPAAQTIH